VTFGIRRPRTAQGLPHPADEITSGILEVMTTTDPPPTEVRLRALTESDVPRVLALNEAEVEMLAPMDELRLRLLHDVAHQFAVIDVDGTFGGFVVTFAPGADYDSENYRWFTERYGAGFLYLDRVVVDPAVRRRGVAGRVYDLVESVASAYGLLALEVNLVPRNDASLAFHLARGFVEVGRLGDDSHLVSLQTKQLR
jgi:predicted GNAT superfamily acetyltransferase